eukprot:sb/3475674/
MFPQHTPPIIKSVGGGGRAISRSSSSTFSPAGARLSRASSSSSVRRSLCTPPSPKMGQRPGSRNAGVGDQPARKSQEDREKGLQTRNNELQTRVRQLEEKLASITCENDTLVSNLLTATYEAVE